MRSLGPLRLIWSLLLDRAHVLGEPRPADHLPDREDLTDVEPVVIREPADRRPERLPALLPVQVKVAHEVLRGQPVEERIRGAADLAPGLEGLLERGRAHRRAGRELVLDVLARHKASRAMEEV